MMDIIYLAQTLSDLNNDDANEGTFFDTKEEAMRFADSVPSIVRITALDINSGDREVVWSGEEETPLEEKKENVKYDSITQEVHDRSKLLRNVSVPVVYYLVNFYAADNGLKRSKVNPIDAAEYFDDFGSTGAICLDLWWDADLSDSNAQELALADPKFVETLRKLGDEMGVNNDPDGRPTEDKLSDEELFRWNFVDGIDEETRDEVIADFKKMYYDIKEEFSVAELDKFANDDAVYDDPFDIDFDVEPAESEPAEVDTGKKVPEIPNFSGSVELGDEPESVVNVTRSSSLLGGEHENLVDINVQCEDSDEDLTAALKELICSLGLEDEFNLDSCDPECESPECPEEPVEPAEEPAVEPAVEPEEVKDLSKEDEVKVEMPEKVADEVKDGDMLVVKVDNKEKPELEEPEDDDDMTDEEFFEELGKELKNSRSCSEAVHEESEDGEIIHISDDALNGLDLDDEERD